MDSHYRLKTTIMNMTAIRLQAPAPAKPVGPEPHDSWEFISGSVIQRFLDFYWVKHGVSHDTLKAYRTDLIALDRWMLLFRSKTLVTACEQDIREFLTAKYLSGNRTLSGLPSLSCIKRFYFYLLEGGFRADDPTENVFVRTPRLSRRDLSVVPSAPR
jgi:site-specific recombinase XerD